MAKLLKSVFSTILVCCAGDSAAAQIAAPSIASLLPDVSAISPANAAGVLQYCVQHQLVSSTAIEPVLSPLTSKKDIKASPLYSDGKQGRIVAGGKSVCQTERVGSSSPVYINAEERAGRNLPNVIRREHQPWSQFMPQSNIGLDRTRSLVVR